MTAKCLGDFRGLASVSLVCRVSSSPLVPPWCATHTGAVSQHGVSKTPKTPRHPRVDATPCWWPVVSASVVPERRRAPRREHRLPKPTAIVTAWLLSCTLRTLRELKSHQTFSHGSQVREVSSSRHRLPTGYPLTPKIPFPQKTRCERTPKILSNPKAKSAVVRMNPPKTLVLSPLIHVNDYAFDSDAYRHCPQWARAAPRMPQNASAQADAAHVPYTINRGIQ